MTDEKQADATQQDPSVSVLKVYMKDCSFEAPNTPEIFNASDKEPEIEVSLGYSASQLDDNLHEVVLTVTVTAKVDDKAMYLAEVHQAGIFEFIGFDEELLDSAIGIWCPTQLYPYAREVICDLTAKGGFMPLLLDHQNFETIYEQNQGQEETQH